MKTKGAKKNLTFWNKGSESLPATDSTIGSTAGGLSVEGSVAKSGLLEQWTEILRDGSSCFEKTEARGLESDRGRGKNPKFPASNRAIGERGRWGFWRVLEGIGEEKISLFMASSCFLESFLFYPPPSLSLSLSDQMRKGSAEERRRCAG